MKKFLEFAVSLLPYMFVFVAAFYHPSDPDLGWHLKYGEYFFKHSSILRENIFSTMMPDYVWPNTSWGTDILTFGVWQLGGFVGLAAFASAIVAATFFFFSRAAKLSLWDQAFLFPILVYFVSPLNSVSFRGQQISLLLTGVMFYLLRLSYDNKKTAFVLLFLFLLWVNLHGQFILGLGLFLLWIFVRIATTFIASERDKHVLVSDVRFWTGVFALSFLATFVNPFGIHVHLQALSHFGDPNLKYIAEYLPFYDQSQLWMNLMIALVLVFTGLIFYFFHGTLQKQIPQAILVFILFGLTMTVRRYAWTFYYLMLPLLQPVIGIYTPGKKWSFVFSSIFLLGALSYVVADRLPLDQYIHMSWRSYCNEAGCSPKAFEFLAKHQESFLIKKHPDKLLTFYDWGGFLIWNYPSVKPSIDGRMHLWRDKHGFSAFDEYYPLEQNWKDVDKSAYNVVFMSPKKPLYQRLVQLVKEGRWQEVYKDQKAGIFVRNSEAKKALP